MLMPEQGSRSAEACNNLVHNQQHLIAPANLLQHRIILRNRGNDSASGGNGLDYDCGNRVFPLTLNHLFKRACAIYIAAGIAFSK
ncbi:hypothetical protein D3C73_1479870 [compost metagenome]